MASNQPSGSLNSATTSHAVKCGAFMRHFVADEPILIARFSVPCSTDSLEIIAMACSR